MGTLNKPIVFSIVAIILGLLFISLDAKSEVYYHKKVDGKHVYTNIKPSEKGYKKIYTTSPGRFQSKYYYGGSTWYSKNYDDLINYYSNVYDLDPMLVKAIIKVESNFRSGAVSPKGAVGLMQLMPGTANDLGVRNSLSPTQNIEGGTKYLRKLMDMFNEDLDLSLAGYNAGENAVIRYGWSIPPYPETRNYVRKVRYHYNHLKNDPKNKPVIKKREVIATKSKPKKSSFSYKERLEEVGTKFEPKDKVSENSNVKVKSVEYKTVGNNQPYKYSLQVASYSDYESAQENLNLLSKNSDYAYLQEASIPGKGTYYRVKIGKFTSRDNALIFAENFKNNHPKYKTAFVTNY